MSNASNVDFDKNGNMFDAMIVIVRYFAQKLYNVYW